LPDFRHNRLFYRIVTSFGKRITSYQSFNPQESAFYDAVLFHGFVGVIGAAGCESTGIYTKIAGTKRFFVYFY